MDIYFFIKKLIKLKIAHEKYNNIMDYDKIAIKLSKKKKSKKKQILLMEKLNQILLIEKLKF